MSWLDAITKPLAKVQQNVIRIATTNPVVAPIIKQYQQRVPAPVRQYLNPRLNPLSTLHDIAGAQSALLGRNEPSSWAIYGAGLANPIAGALAAVSQIEGDAPQGETLYDNWQRLCYKSKADMRQRVAEAEHKDAARALIGRLPTPGSSSRFIPSPPSVQNSVVTPRSANYADNLIDSNTRQLGVSAPRTAVVPTTASPIPYKAYEAAVTTGLAQGEVAPKDLYRAQEYYGKMMEESGELQRRLKDVGGAAGMSDEALMTWAQKNPALAYREMLKRERRARLGAYE